MIQRHYEWEPKIYELENNENGRFHFTKPYNKLGSTGNTQTRYTPDYSKINEKGIVDGADLKDLDECQIQQVGVIDADAGEGLEQAEPSEGGAEGEGGEGGVGEEVEGPGEAHAVEAHGGHPLRHSAERLPAEPLRRRRLQVRRPVGAGQLHPPPGAVYDPS